MTATTSPDWHDPAAPRCRRAGCGHVLDAHSGRCVLICCTCTGWVAPLQPVQDLAGRVVANGRASHA